MLCPHALILTLALPAPDGAARDSYAGIPWDFALILIFLAVVAPWRGRARMARLMAVPRTTPLDRMVVYASTIALQWVLTGLVVWRAAARGLLPADLAIALPDAFRALVTGVALVGLIVLIQVASLRHLSRLPAEQQGFTGVLARRFLPQSGVEALVFFALAVTAGVCEEIIFRGFVFTVLARAAGDAVWVGLLGSAAMFAVAHLYQGRRGVAATFVGGLLFGVSRIVSGSILPAIVAHAVADLTVGLAAPRMLVGEKSASREERV